MPPLGQINRIIRSQNPFDGYFVVKSHQVWGKELPDATSLNNHASKAILDAIKKVNDGKLETAGITLLAPKGVGKTHVLSRVRHRLQQHGGGIFIYLCEYGKLSQIKQQFLQGLISSLRKAGNQEVMQCQELITVLLNKTIKKEFTAKKLIANFPAIIAKKPQLIDQLTHQIYQLGVGVEDPDLVKALLWTLSLVHAPYALNWLAGKELTEAQSQKMGLPNVSQNDKDAYAFNIALQLLNLIGYCSTPVICFDELDGAESGDEDDALVAGYSRSQVVVSLGKDIYNNLKKGVLVTAMYPMTWRSEVQVLPQVTAIEDRIAAKKIELNHLKLPDVIALVSRWLEEFYNQHDVDPPHKLYPFNEEELRKNFEEARPPVREVLQWCADNFGPGPDPIGKLERLYEETDSDLEAFIDDNEKIANALAFCLKTLEGQTLEGVTIETIDRDIRPKYRNNGYIQFKVIGQENNEPVKIGVGILQNSNGRSVGAGLKRLTWYRDFGLTRGCLVRSKSIRSYWQGANRHLTKLIDELGGEWVSPKEDEIRPLVALRKIARNLEDYEIKQEHFQQFLEEKRLIIENPLIKEILSAPSGTTPGEVTDEDEEFEQAEKAVSESSDSEALSEAEELTACLET
ncbi:MAG: hypothetical protein F6K42_10150 [Leptolyngbya sp. SIO1D8]|nr:hypothetical protein [Leptolyngbya sp. SIO1D8]